MTIDDLRRVARDFAKSEPLVRRLYLFGSRARGDHRPESDVDIAVLVRIDPELRQGVSVSTSRLD